MSDITELQSHAAEVRTRFFATLDALEERGRRLTDLRHFVRRKRAPIAATILILLGVGALVAWRKGSAARARARRRHELVAGLFPWQIVVVRRR